MFFKMIFFQRANVEGRGTIDMVFAARQLQEKCREQNINHYSTYVEFSILLAWKVYGEYW